MYFLKGVVEFTAVSSWFFYYSALAITFWVILEYLKDKVNFKNSNLFIKIGKFCIIIAYITYAINVVFNVACKQQLREQIIIESIKMNEKMKKNNNLYNLNDKKSIKENNKNENITKKDKIK